MSFTKRKENRLKAWDQYRAVLKKYSKQPLIKNVDIEELKKQFTVAPVAEEPVKANKKKVSTEEVVVEAAAPVVE